MCMHQKIWEAKTDRTENRSKENQIVVGDFNTPLSTTDGTN